MVGTIGDDCLSSDDIWSDRCCLDFVVQDQESIYEEFYVCRIFNGSGQVVAEFLFVPGNRTMVNRKQIKIVKRSVGNDPDKVQLREQMVEGGKDVNQTAASVVTKWIREFRQRQLEHRWPV
jgi:hypothetical protein